MREVCTKVTEGTVVKMANGHNHNELNSKFTHTALKSQ